MIGAILGDIIGSPYEFDRGNKTKYFPLFSRRSHFTDDSVMTVAVADALMKSMGKPDEEVKAELVSTMRNWGLKYPEAGYGSRFILWLFSSEQKPYKSYGNGSAMRVSPVGWLYDTLEETRHYARLTASVSHNHKEGIKGAEATASAIFMARKGEKKEDIKKYIINEFGYDLSRTCDEIRPGYHHVETCQQTVPEAITAFIEGEDFEDVIRTAVSLGGDCDTLTCIAGSIAEAFYGVPEDFVEKMRKLIPDDFKEVIERFQKYRKEETDVNVKGLIGNQIIEEAFDAFADDQTNDNFVEIIGSIMYRRQEGGRILVQIKPVVNNDEVIVIASNVKLGDTFTIRRDVDYEFAQIEDEYGGFWIGAYTTYEVYEDADQESLLALCTMKSFFDACVQMENVKGVYFNPGSEHYMLMPKEIIERYLRYDADDGD